jgi:hypothetical protein
MYMYLYVFFIPLYIKLYMFRVLLHPSSGAQTVAYSHRWVCVCARARARVRACVRVCVCVCNSFGVLIHWSRYWLGHPRTFTTVRNKEHISTSSWTFN